MHICVVIFIFTEILVYDGAHGTAVRLVGGASALEGRVEVYHSSQWGTVCDDGFDDKDAMVFCRMLGYPRRGIAYQAAHFGEGSGQIWLDDLGCHGNEGDIRLCPFNGNTYGKHNCRHYEDAGISCANHCNKLVITNGNTISSNLVGSHATFNCIKGFDFSGQNISTCLNNLAWSNTKVSCQPKDCGIPHAPSNGQVLLKNSSSTYGSSARVRCNDGFIVYGHSDSEITLQCKETGKWSSENYTCVPVGCSDLVMKNGYTISTTNLVGSNATFNCIEGYDFVGQNVSTCLENSEWSNTNVSCQPKDCGMPHLPNNGQVLLEDSSSTYGSSARVSCNDGYHVYGHNGSEITLQCIETGKWSSENYTCVPVDCEEWMESNTTSSSVTYSNSTIYGSKALLRCDLGFHIEHTRDVFTETVTCTANGTWSKRFPPTCVAIECPPVKLQPNVNILNYSHLNLQYLVGSIISFGCANSTSIIGRNFITCLVDGAWSGNPPVCEKVTSEKFCPDDIDIYGHIWNITKAGQIISLACPDGYIGEITRHCLVDGSWLYPMYNCIHKSIAEISQALQHPTEKDIQINLQKLSSLTSVTHSSGRPAFGGELNQVTNILDTIANIGENMSVTTEQTESFLSVTSNLLDQQNAKSWQAMGNDTEQPLEHQGAMRVLNVVDKYVALISKGIGDLGNTSKTFAASNLVVHVAGIHNTTNDGISFPGNGTSLGISSALHLPDKSLKDSKKYSAVFYRNLSGIVSASSNEHRPLQRSINTEIVSVNMDNWEYNPSFEILLTFMHFEKSLSFPTCSFWNESESVWDSSGCKVVHTNQSHTVCSCSHLTNFAILMSPFIQENVNTKALDIISIVCCSISILGLVLTVALHIYFHRHMKTDQTRIVILMNLSTALIFSYALFLGGVDRTENRIVCTTIAALLHYIYLVVFCLMLAEGVDIFMSVRFVFTTKSKFKWIILAAWVFPAMVVGIALGASRTDGYGTEQFCWLSVESGVIWAFVGPALAIITVNAVFLVVVMKTMFGSHAISQKKISDKSKMAVRCLLILLPLTGITWVLGIFYVNKSMAWVQYVFAVCNSLQGLVIFIFHCALNTQIHDAVLHKRKRSGTIMSTKSRSTSVTFRRMSGINSTSMTVTESSISESEEKKQGITGGIMSSSKKDEEEDSTSTPLQTETLSCKL